MLMLMDGGAGLGRCIFGFVLSCENPAVCGTHPDVPGYRGFRDGCNGYEQRLTEARQPTGSPWCRRCWSTFWRGGRQGAVLEGRARAVSDVRAGRAAPRDGPHPRRRVAVPARPGRRCRKRPGQPDVSRRAGPRGAEDCRAGRGVGRRGGHLRRAGLKKPDVSLLSEEFLREVRGMRQRNLAVELVRKLLKGELTTRRRKNVVQARSFAEMLEQTIRRYQNRAVEGVQVIEEQIGLARGVCEANARGESLGLSDNALAFYDALGVKRHRGSGARRRDAAWHRPRTGRDRTGQRDHRLDAARERPARLRVLVKRILRKHGYPRDKEESATRTVLEHAAVLSVNGRQELTESVWTGCRPQHVGAGSEAPSCKSPSGRACAERPSRPSAPRSGGGAERRVLTAASTRVRCASTVPSATTTSWGRP